MLFQNLHRAFSGNTRTLYFLSSSMAQNSVALAGFVRGSDYGFYDHDWLKSQTSYLIVPLILDTISIVSLMAYLIGKRSV